MNPYLILAIMFVLGVVSVVTSVRTDWRSPWEIPLFVAGVFLMAASVIGAGITAAHQADKSRCLNTLPQVSNRQTKWLDGQCYMQADDGKFVPQEWIEEGYERD